MVAAAAAILLLAVVVWSAFAGDGDEDGDRATERRSPTTQVAEPAPDPTAGSSSTEPVDPAGATTTTTKDDDATATATGDDASPCTVPDAELLGLLRDHPPLASLADGLTVTQVRCAGSWSTAVVAAADTDQSLAVFRNDEGGWALVLVGSAEPCSGLGIPPAAEGPLGCGDW